MAGRHGAPFDLNLLLVFDALMREGSVTAAGRVVGLSQPSMSNALRRLRSACDDPLFVRGRDGMRPTPEALRLAGPVAEALAIVRTGVLGRIPFDPRRATRTFRLLASDVGEIAILPRLWRAVSAEAPGIGIVAISRARQDYVAALEAGEADMALARALPRVPGLRQRRLFDDRYVVVARAGHPRVRGSLDGAGFAAEAHVASGAADADVLARIAAEHGVELRVGLRVAHLLAAAVIAARTDMLAVVPEEVSGELGALGGAQVLPLPFDVPEVPVHLYWHPRVDRDEANRWLRARLASLFPARRFSEN